MSNYSQIVLYGPKDSLTLNDPNKFLKGVQLDAELGAISSAIATKIDSTTASPSVTNLNVTSATVPTNGIYLPATNQVAVSTNGVIRASWAAAGAGLSNATGNTTFSAAVQNPALNLNQGAITSVQGVNAAVANNSPSTLFTLPNNTQQATAWLFVAASGQQNSAPNYAVTALIIAVGAAANLVALNTSVGVLMALSLSGLSINVTQSSGSTLAVQYSALRIM